LRTIYTEEVNTVAKKAKKGKKPAKKGKK